MAIGSLYQAIVNMHGFEKPWAMSFGFKQISGGNDAGTLESLASALSTRFDTLFRACLSFNHNVQSIEVREVTQGDEIPGVSPVIDQPGTVEELSLPNSNPALILWTTIAPNAKFNGKTYVSGCPITFVTNGVLESGGAAAYQAWADSMLDDVQLSGDQDADFTPVIISRYEDGEKRSVPIGYELELATVNPTVKNQRVRRTNIKGVPLI